jgi:hypothetical protein
VATPAQDLTETQAQVGHDEVIPLRDDRRATARATPSRRRVIDDDDDEEDAAPVGPAPKRRKTSEDQYIGILTKCLEGVTQTLNKVQTEIAVINATQDRLMDIVHRNYGSNRQPNVGHLTALSRKMNIRPYSGQKGDAGRFISDLLNYYRLLEKINPEPLGEAGVIFASSFLEGPARQWYERKLREGTYKTLNDFSEQLSLTFDGPFYPDECREKLEKLRQGSTAIIQFNSTFQNLLFYSKITDELMICTLYERGVNLEILNKMNNIVGGALPRNHVKLFELAFQADSLLQKEVHTNAEKTLRDKVLDAKRGSFQRQKANENAKQAYKPQGEKKLCAHCKKPGHNEQECWAKDPSKRPKKGFKINVIKAKDAMDIDQDVSFGMNKESNYYSCVPVNIHLYINGAEKLAKGLVDTGADITVLAKDFVEKYQIPCRLLKEAKRALAVDGSEVAVTHYCPEVPMRLDETWEQTNFLVTDVSSYDIILGFDWCKQHKIQFDWETPGKVIIKQRLKDKIVVIENGNIKGPENNSSRKEIQNCLKRTIEFISKYPERVPHAHKDDADSEDEPYDEDDVNDESPIAITSAAEMGQLIDTPENRIYQILLTDILPDTSDPKEPKEVKLPQTLATYADVFEKKNADRLPEHRSYDLAIELLPGKQPPFGPIYGLATPELKVLREYIDEHLAKGFIRPSKSPAGAPILFVKKKDGSLRLCVDYRGLNAVTKKNRLSLPLISEMLEQTKGATIFTKIDLRGAYNLLRIQKGDEWKTAFRTRYGHFEYAVMPFGLSNAPAAFQNLMNDVLRDFLDQGVINLLDDILIYSKLGEDHDAKVRAVLDRLRANKLYAKLEKCEFSVDRVEFLGHILSKEGVSMCKSKVDAILKWPVPRTVKDVQAFLGLANYYRRFVKGFSRIAQRLTFLLRKDTPWQWGDKEDKAFQTLKIAFTTAPVLKQPDLDRPFLMECDASDYALGAVLSQEGDDGKQHPVAFYSRKLLPAEQNYEIHDKELLAIKAALQEWRHVLLGTAEPITIYSDHKSLEYFLSTKKLTRRQARWSLFLNEFNFTIKYRPGYKQGKPDALSRRPDYLDSKNCESGPVLTRKHFAQLCALTLMTQEFQPEFMTIIQKDTADDEMSKLSDTELLGKQMDRREGIIYKEGLIYVPKGEARLAILKARHDALAAGHYGNQKTYELISRDFWWPGMRAYIKHYIDTCDICNRAKAKRHKPNGLLQPLPISKGPWSSVTLDFIVQLPESDGFNAILVVVCRYTKMAHFIPCRTEIDAAKTAQLFIDHVFRLHGTPDEIISDRGPQFASKFWKTFFDQLSTNIKLSTAFHPQTDGQSERTNQTLEQYLRCFIDYQQTNWHKLLTFAEFSYNNTEHSSLKCSPFFANYGYNPSLDVKVKENGTSLAPSAQEWAKHIQKVHQELSLILESARERMKFFADKTRQQAPSYKVGDLVWLRRKNITTARKIDKLDYRHLGPFPITRIINDVAYEIRLPATMRIHNVFHASLLEPYVKNRIEGRTPAPPPPVIINDQVEYEVQEVLDSRVRGKTVEYLVRWRNFGPNDDSWEPAANLANSNELVATYNERNPNKLANAANRVNNGKRAKSRGGKLNKKPKKVHFELP